jgi:uncharacterized Zn finger protein (UPF0148 family)
MADDTAAVTASVCPWCSSPLSNADAETCPICGAQLVPDTDAQVPGVTTIDAEAIVRAAHQPTPQRRNRLLSWISGEYDTGSDEPAAPGSVAPPDDAVRREMLRLELEAEVANLHAEAGLILAEAEVEAHEEGLAVAGAEASDAPAETVEEPGASEPAPDAPETDRA